MTKKTRGAGGDTREQLPEGTTSELTELRTLFMEAQTATQTSIQQLGAMLAAHLDALTVALTPRVEHQGQHGVQAPLPPVQQHLPPLQHPQQQQQLPPPRPGHHQRAPPQHQLHPHQQFLPPPPQDRRQRNQHQFPIEEDEDAQHRQVFLEDLQQRDNYGNQWEKRFRVDIPEFHGGLRGDDLIDWLISVEEILEFKQVPPAWRVPLVATRFRSHAAKWWKQLKSTRSRTGKAPIQS